MKFLLKSLISVVLMVELLIFFAPKSNLYYWGEHALKAFNVFISNESVEDSGWRLNIYAAELYFDKLTLAEVDKISLSPWLLYNAIEVEGIHIDEGFVDFLPLEITRLGVAYAIYNPLQATLHGESDAGYFNGEVDLLERTVLIRLHVDQKAQKRYRNALARLKKTEEGYSYEYRF